MVHSCAELYLPGRETVPEIQSRAAAPATNGTDLTLEMGEAVSIRLTGRPFRVTCVTGRLWATVDGDAEDHVLLPGEESMFRGRGTAVIQALRVATARVSCSS